MNICNVSQHLGSGNAWEMKQHPFTNYFGGHAGKKVFTHAHQLSCFPMGHNSICQRRCQKHVPGARGLEQSLGLLGAQFHSDSTCTEDDTISEAVEYASGSFDRDQNVYVGEACLKGKQG